MENTVVIHTDGGCSPNPGRGGWGAILRYKNSFRELCGGLTETTNNQMELMGAICALEALTRPCKVVLYTDSKYVQNGITSWIKGWKKNGWKTKQREPVKNADLWQRLDAACVRHKVEWKWVKGHSGNKDNERADELAAIGRQQAITEKQERSNNVIRTVRPASGGEIDAGEAVFGTPRDSLPGDGCQGHLRAPGHVAQEGLSV